MGTNMTIENDRAEQVSGKSRLRATSRIALAIFVVGPILGEAFLQLLGFGHPALVTSDSPAGYELLPRQSIRRLWPLSDSWISHVRTNRLGMRSDPLAETKPSGTLRIYFLGDSITYGTTQVDQSQLFSELVHRELPSLTHQSVEVMNGAISGWAIANEPAFVKEHGTLGADRLILVINDGDPTQPMASLPPNDGIPSLEHNPRWGFQELWDRGLRAKINGLLGRGADNFRDPGTTIAADALILQQNLGYLAELRSFVEASGGKLSILYIPFREAYDSAKLSAAAGPGRDAVETWAQQHSVPFFNIGADLARYPATSILLRDHTHFNVAGNRAIATAIEQHWTTLVN